MFKVYGAYRYSDMTEGRGPYVLDRIFESRHIAELYINSKPGVMGRRYEWTKGKCKDWKVEEIEVIENEDVEVSFNLKGKNHAHKP